MGQCCLKTQEVLAMVRKAFRRWTVVALLTALVGVGAAGCVAVPVGGGYGYGYAEPTVVVPAPGIVVTPGYGYHHAYGRRYRGFRG
jgi:hypothetical protein